MLFENLLLLIFICSRYNFFWSNNPIPTWLLKECSALLAPTITNIVNLSLSSGNFHHTLKESVISHLLKKPTLDNDELSNYRPISNLSLISTRSPASAGIANRPLVFLGIFLIFGSNTPTWSVENQLHY